MEKYNSYTIDDLINKVSSYIKSAAEIDLIKKAQETRLGYNGYKTSFKSVAMLGSNIFLRSMDKAESLQHSLDSRGYDGEIPMYKPQNRSDD